MSDDDYITPAEVQPGMHVEIVQRPWRGVITAPLVQGVFTADRDDALGDRRTSWAVDNIGSIRLLLDPLPATPGERFWGKAEGHPAEWWFVSVLTNVRQRYVSASGFDWDSEQCKRYGLVRLPDPEVQA